MIKTVKTRYSNNFSFYENDTVIGKSIELYGEYAQREIDFMLNILNDKCIVYDIGSNIGVHATAFASVAKAVYCFEPNQNNFMLLLKNTQHLKNVLAINAAVTNKNSIVPIQDFDINSQEANYGSVSVGKGSGAALGIQLDNWNFRKPDFIKIDVEGHEYQVIQGCDGVIRSAKPVVYFEAHETPDLPQLYDYFIALNYKLYWCEVVNYNSNNFNQNTNDIFKGTGTFSILAVPPTYNWNLPLDMMLDRDDDAFKLIERAKARKQGKQNESAEQS